MNLVSKEFGSDGPRSLGLGHGDPLATATTPTSVTTPNLVKLQKLAPRVLQGNSRWSKVTGFDLVPMTY